MGVICAWKRVASAAVMALGAALAGCHSAPSEPILTAEQQALNAQSFERVWTLVRDNHFDPALNGVDWDAAKKELAPKAALATTMTEARRAMNELIGRLKQSHFGVLPAEAYREAAGEPGQAGGSKSGLDAKDTPGEGQSGVRVRVVDDQALIVAVRKGSPGQAAGVRAGSVIKAVNGKSLSTAIGAIKEATRDHEGSALLLTLALEARLTGAVGSERVLTVDEAGTEVERRIVLGPPEGSPAKFGNLPTIYYTFDSYRPVPDVGVIAFSIFLEPGVLMPAFTKAVQSFADAKGIVVDLRGNLGGIGAMAMGIGGHFVSERNLKLGTMITRESKLNFVLNPRADAYGGKVAVLVDEMSLSTSEILAGGLQAIGRARIFGTRTGGAALPSRVEVLPNGDRFQYAFADYVDARGGRLEGRGVTPDEPVRLDRAAMLAGKDPVLEAAIAWIRGAQATGAER